MKKAITPGTEKLKDMPELMEVIINIQTMKKVIDPNYDPFKHFKTLQRATNDNLHTLQNILIPQYNKIILNNQK